MPYQARTILGAPFPESGRGFMRGAGEVDRSGRPLGPAPAPHFVTRALKYVAVRRLEPTANGTQPDFAGLSCPFLRLASYSATWRRTAQLPDGASLNDKRQLSRSRYCFTKSQPTSAM